jgi:V8-like Glu-specific endopeptidase
MGELALPPSTDGPVNHAFARFAALVFVWAVAPLASAQQTLEAPPPSMHLAYALDSGPVVNTTGHAEVVFSQVVVVQGASWLRLFFDRVELAGNVDSGNHAILRLTSLYDAEVQELDATEVRRWSRSSGYFNGDGVLVEIVAQPNTGASRVALGHVVQGLQWQGGGYQANCGTDTRIASFDARGGRLLPAGCTAWIIGDCTSCFLTAGHCLSSGMVIEFNVPLSQGNGSLNHPPIEDQFPVDPVSVQGQSQGVGWDWGYIGTFTNNLGQTAFAHELARWGTGPSPAFTNQEHIRVTGYGVDIGTANQTQQTVVGNWTNQSVNYFNMNTYVEGGNSGSPGIHEESGIAIGIVTHTSCPSASVQQNYATRLTNVNLAAALANPLGVCAAATCQGVGQAYCPTGPLMSVISGTGSASLGANDLVLHANNIPTNKSGIFMYSANKQNVAFGVSRLCVGGGGFPIRRLPAVNSGAGTSFTLALDNTALPAGDVFNPSDVIHFQAWFRTGQSSTETSNGLTVTFLP